jgi:hypothetical protein
MIVTAPEFRPTTVGETITYYPHDMVDGPIVGHYNLFDHQEIVVTIRDTEVRIANHFGEAQFPGPTVVTFCGNIHTWRREKGYE